MKKYIAILLATVILSFYFFPFQFRFIPSVNSKMALAGIGLPILMLALGRKNDAAVDNNFFKLSIFAAFVSLIAYISITVNDTYDFTYVSYIVSMWVWLCAAYVVVSLIRHIHGYVSVFLLCNYLIALCVSQCVLALTIEFYEPIKQIIYSIIDVDTVNFMEDKRRLMGLGCGLDVAGSRFSAVLVMISYICINYSNKVAKYVYLYICSFIIISLIGNMISRTTTVGMMISALYFIIAFIFSESANFKKRFLLWLMVLIVLLVPIIVYTYYNVPDFYRHMRFGFEGFFSLAESGEWDVGSNEKLKGMYVFPETFKTWLIGDGFFGATTSDPYYIGKEWKSSYMDTDVGYLRFIFYFGILGLFTFSYFMYEVAKTCMSKFSCHRLLFELLLVINFIVWFKVSTDIFLVFAPFLCISKEENETFEKTMI